MERVKNRRSTKMTELEQEREAMVASFIFGRTFYIFHLRRLTFPYIFCLDTMQHLSVSLCIVSLYFLRQPDIWLIPQLCSTSPTLETHKRRRCYRWKYKEDTRKYEKKMYLVYKENKRRYKENTKKIKGNTKKIQGNTKKIQWNTKKIQKNTKKKTKKLQRRYKEIQRRYKENTKKIQRRYKEIQGRHKENTKKIQIRKLNAHSKILKIVIFGGPWWFRIVSMNLKLFWNCLMGVGTGVSSQLDCNILFLRYELEKRLRSVKAGGGETLVWLSVQPSEAFSSSVNNDQYNFSRSGTIFILMRKTIRAATWIKSMVLNQGYTMEEKG